MAAATDGAPPGEQLYTRGGPNVPDNRGQSMVRGQRRRQSRPGTACTVSGRVAPPASRGTRYHAFSPAHPFSASRRWPSTWRSSRRRRRCGRWSACTCCCRRWGPPCGPSRCRCAQPAAGFSTVALFRQASGKGAQQRQALQPGSSCCCFRGPTVLHTDGPAPALRGLQECNWDEERALTMLRRFQVRRKPRCIPRCPSREVLLLPPGWASPCLPSHPHAPRALPAPAAPRPSPAPPLQVAKADNLSKLHKERRRHQMHLQSGKPERRRGDKVRRERAPCPCRRPGWSTADMATAVAGHLLQPEV